MLSKIFDYLTQYGLRVRGGFHPLAEDGVPASSEGREVGTLVLIGNIGGEFWPAFVGSPEHADRQPHGLDRWTRRVLDDLAMQVGAGSLYPFGGPPYLPFQRWAMRAESVAPSPIGILIHPDFGLWHAYRGALAFPDRFDLPAPADRTPPCDGCSDRPCLAACPVGAFSDAGYDVDACAGHLSGASGGVCMTGGCLARRVCPIGRQYAYEAPQAAFHMAAFVASKTVNR